MKYVFIGGIPAAGKSYLAGKVAKAFKVQHIDIDRWRSELKKDPNLEPWVNFVWHQNEEKYWQSTDSQKHWQNLKNQSEAIWPIIKEKINKVVAAGEPAIFEGVNILPHLAKADLDFPGIYFLGKSFAQIFKRLKKEPCWGRTEELQKKEAEMFIREGSIFKKEAEKYGFKTFIDLRKAEKELLNLLKI